MEIIIDVIQEVLSIVPVPGLQPAFAILKSIWIAVQQTQACQAQLGVLTSCTATLLKALNKQYHNGQLNEESTFQQLQDLHKLLEELANFVQKRSSFSFLKLLFVKDQSLTMIDAYQARIGATITAFQISALVSIRQWQYENELSRRADQRSLCLRLEELAANQVLLAEALNIEKNNPMAMMTTFKRRIDEKKGGKEELNFYSQSFRYLLTASGQQVDIKPWTISPFDVEFGEIIGGGGFAVIYRGTWNQTEVALKVMKNTEKITPSPTAVLREVETWSKLRHPHILQFLGANILDDEPFIVMPLIANGNVRDYIDNNPNCDRLRLIRQAGLGLVCLHSQDVIHGDLKGVNILVDDGGKALLCDFGLSRIKADVNSRSIRSSSGFVGSPNWMAPELFQGGILGFSCDVYSFAMTMYELFTNEIPLGYLAPNMLRELVVDRKVRPTRPNTEEAPQLSDEAWTIIQLCWEAEPTSRPTAEAICNKLNVISAVIPSNSLTAKMFPNQSIVARSLPIKNIEPISHPAGSTPHPERRATGRAFPRFRPKPMPMTEHYHTSLTLENPGNVTSVLQSSDGKVFITGLSEGSCILWNPNVATMILQDIEPSSDPVTAITFESSTSTYAAGFKSGRVIYHYKALSQFPSTVTLTGHNKPIICLHVLNVVVMALSTDPGSQNLVILKWCSSLRGGTNSIVTTLPLLGIDPYSCLCAAFSSDGKEVYIGTSGGSLFVSSTNNGQFVHRPFHLASAECRSLALSPYGKKIMVSYSSGEIRLWDVKAKSYSVLRVAGDTMCFGINFPAYSSLPVTFSPDGSYVAYASASNPRTVEIQDVASKQITAYIDLDGAPTVGIQSLDISPNNKGLIVAFHNSSHIMVCVWD